MKNPETAKQRIAILKEWVWRLGLKDWSIRAQLNCSESELKNANAAGESDYRISIKSAEIRILAEKYFEDESEYDFEQTLVHEFLHLKFGILWNNASDIAQDLLHQTIEELAIALVEAKRSTP